MGRRSEWWRSGVTGRNGGAGRAAIAAVALGTVSALVACGFGKGPRGARAAEGEAPVECPAVKPPGDSPARRLRGMWIATVGNIDWPSAKGLPAAEQQAEYRRLLDTARALNLNAVFVQVRPAGDALYPSPYEPWSQWLSGTQGIDPGYDVLEFLLGEAHARNLEFHAWFNPYRASWRADPDTLAPTHPARRHPGWVVRSGKGLWYDPGLPQVRDLTTKVVLDVVDRYDIDGVHFDDYFYPYPGQGPFKDAGTYARYGEGRGKAAWRRHNVDALIEDLSTRIHRAKPWVQFGISPFGVWRNKTSDPDGSATRALQSYDAIYADTRAWIRNGWVDYITPQLYWPIGDTRADYRVLVDWWSRQVAGTPVRLTIGQAAYRAGEAGRWRRPGELSRHLTLNTRFPAVRGDVFFSARSLVADRAGFATRLRADHYSRPAIPPAVAGPGAGPPAPATGLRARQDGTSVRLRWRGSNATSYAVYRGEGEHGRCAPVDPAALLVTVRGTAAVDQGVRPGETYTYYVTALDRRHHESAPGRALRITVERG